MPDINHTTYQSRIATYLLSAIALCLILYFGKPLFVPMSFGLLLAIICYPACKWLESKRLPRTLSATLLILLVALLFAVLLWLLGYEINLLSAHKSALSAKLGEYWSSVQIWAAQRFGFQLKLENELLPDITTNMQENLGGTLNSIVSATSSALLLLILVPIFGVLFLTHRDTFVRFLETVVGEQYKSRLRTILHESLLNYFRFVKGTFFVYCIVGCLNSLGLFLLGIEHAILFGMIAAFMTIIPYVGILVSAALPISIALITKDSLWYPAGVIMVFTFVQYLEANLIYPRIVGQQLNLSTWVVLVTIITGTILWGISGMILFVPFAGILKIVSDNIPELKALNILLSRTERGKKEK